MVFTEKKEKRIEKLINNKTQRKNNIDDRVVLLCVAFVGLIEFAKEDVRVQRRREECRPQQVGGCH